MQAYIAVLFSGRCKQPVTVMNQSSIRQAIAKLWGQQLGLLVLITAGLWVVKAPVIAKSVLLGGLLYWIPNAYFTLYAFRFRGAHAARDMLRSIYRGEMGKFVLTGLGFALIFIGAQPVNAVALFSAYMAMTLLQWLLVSRW